MISKNTNVIKKNMGSKWFAILWGWDPLEYLQVIHKCLGLYHYVSKVDLCKSYIFIFINLNFAYLILEKGNECFTDLPGELSSLLRQKLSVYKWHSVSCACIRHGLM